jgi:hypothetical protein
VSKKKPKLKVPTHLLNEIEADNVVLMLGAGASRVRRARKPTIPPPSVAIWQGCFLIVVLYLNIKNLS